MNSDAGPVFGGTLADHSLRIGGTKSSSRTKDLSREEN